MKGLKQIGAYMREKREEAWMSYGTLADITRVPVEQIVLIEKGDPKCGFDELVRLGWWFGLRIKVKIL
jgi:predicted transcriptional regulator